MTEKEKKQFLNKTYGRSQGRKIYRSYQKIEKKSMAFENRDRHIDLRFFRHNDVLCQEAFAVEVNNRMIIGQMGFDIGG